MISTFVIKPTERTLISTGPCVVLNNDSDILINFSNENGEIFKTTNYCDRPEYIRCNGDIYAQSELKNTTCKVSGIVCHCKPPEARQLWGSKPYATLIDIDAYKPIIKPLDMCLLRVLKETEIINESYIPIIKPLDITLRSILKDFSVDDKYAYTSSVQPLDITLKQTFFLVEKFVEDKDSYAGSIKPLDITLKRVLIEQNINELDVYTASVKPLDITLKIGA